MGNQCFVHVDGVSINQGIFKLVIIAFLTMGVISGIDLLFHVYKFLIASFPTSYWFEMIMGCVDLLAEVCGHHFTF